MPTIAPRSLRRAATIASLTAIAFGATACPPQPTPDVSHTSRWTNATFAAAERNTTLEIAAGIDDPAGGNLGKQLEVRLTQSWCDTDTLVERSLEGGAAAFTGDVRTTHGTANVAGTVILTGTDVRTPAGPGCTAPQTADAVTAAVSLGADVQAEVTGLGTATTYTREDGGEYIYQDASATGSLTLAGGEGSFVFGSSVAAGTWLWQGHWADARGLDIDTLLPV